jgi:hypothetical protein
MRYLFLPVLLGAFTTGLAELGVRFSRRHPDLRVTGAFLLGGAVCLLPVNFMVLCRAGSDPLAARLILPALALYAVLAGAGLWRWCGALHRDLRPLLGIPLLAVNLLAVLGDMPGVSQATAAHRAALVPASITAAVLLQLGTASRFLRRVLNPELLAARVVPWFFGITMAATTAQVAIWRHFHLQLAPQPQQYALAAILAGALLLRWERRAGELRGPGPAYGGESFLGYAALLLGIFLAAGHAWLRPGALLLAGLIWLAQAPRRPGVAHYWVGVTLCLLAGASVGLLPSFPKSRALNMLPVLGLVLALAAGALRALAGRLGESRLRQVALEIQPPILLLTAIITVLSQYHLRSAPWLSGLVLLAAAFFFIVRATRESRRDWLQIAAAAAGLALPYLGCADMEQYRLDTNTLGLGFGVLGCVWLLAGRLLPYPLWRAHGESLTPCFGVLGILGLCLRLFLAGRPELAAPDLAGGLLLAATLFATGWQSRSQTAGILGAVILAVILPLFRIPAGAAPALLHTGTGLVSAAAALALAVACHAARRLELARGVRGVLTVPAWIAAGWLVGKALALQFQAHRDPIPFTASLLLISAAAYAAALFFRAHAAGRVLFHASWLLLGAGITLVCDATGCRGTAMLQYPVLWTGLALTALLGTEVAAARKQPWAWTFLVQPRLTLLAYGSVVLTLILVCLLPYLAVRSDGLLCLALFAAAQLIWHNLRTAQLLHGLMLFLLATAWLCHIPDARATFSNLSRFALITLAAETALEFLPKVRAFLQPLRTPWVAAVTLLSLALAAWVVHASAPVRGGVMPLPFPQQDLLLLGAAVLLAARTQACAGVALPAVLLSYLLLHLPCEATTLFQPWRLALLSLALCLLPFPGRLLSAYQPRLLCGPDAQLPDLYRGRHAFWLIVPGLILAVGAAVGQIADSLSDIPAASRLTQISAPFAAAAAFALAGTYWRRGTHWMVAEGLLPLANLHAIAVLWGDALLRYHLTPVHVISLSLVLTIAELWAMRSLVMRVWHPTPGGVVRALHLGSAMLAGLTLVLLGMNYLTDPDLARIPAGRFCVSGLLSLAAGLYFRSAARRPEHLRSTDGGGMEALWHVALGLTLWCAALMVPALRTPHAALYVLALPAAACWLTAELFLTLRTPSEGNRLTGTRFCNSAIGFALLTLVCYVFRLPSQLVLFPHSPPELHLYHTGAAAALLMGVILLRLRGLCPRPWVALAGGAALIPGLYFLVTWLPGLSPFDFPMAGAWISVAVAHLLILLSYQQSPLRNFIQFIGGIDAGEWHALRRQCGLLLTVAMHAAVAAGVWQGYWTHGEDLTPLLGALVSVLVHQVLLGVPQAALYRLLAVLELLFALHIDFLLPEGVRGVIPARQTVWFLLAAWLSLALYGQRVRPPMETRTLWMAAGWGALLSVGHLAYHGPSTGSGLLVAAGIVLAGMLTPVADDAATARAPALLTLGAPLWFAYFGTRWLTDAELLDFRPLLAGATALLATGSLVRQADRRGAGTIARTPVRRLVHALLALCAREGEDVARALLGATFIGLALLTFLHGGARHGSPEMMLGLALVWGLCCVAWYREGRLRDGWGPYLLSVLSLAGAWIVLRRLLFLHFSFWTYEYDIWLSLGASLAFSAAKRLVHQRQPGLTRTMTGTIWVLPILQCVWLLCFRLNADLTLLVLGVQACLFAWQGGGQKDSPYNAVAMLGFVGFICLLFWAKLDLRCLQAYTIPCGLGMLGLVWLFGDRIAPGLRTAVRGATVLVMLGSCGYYALLDPTYPVGFHLTMLLLSLAVMALGPLLRVQLYLHIGFAGFVTDLAVILVRQGRALEHSVQMMVIGGLLLLLGIAVVGGAILFKTRQEAILACAARVRARLGKWE